MVHHGRAKLLVDLRVGRKRGRAAGAVELLEAVGREVVCDVLTGEPGAEGERRGERMVLNLHEARRLCRFEEGLCDDERDVLAGIVEGPVAERCAALCREVRGELLRRRLNRSEAGCEGGVSKNLEYAWSRESERGVNGADAGVSQGRLDQHGMRHPRQGDIAGVQGAARHLEAAIDAYAGVWALFRPSDVDMRHLLFDARPRGCMVSSMHTLRE